MKTAIVFDCEFLCVEGSQRRFRCAAHDPDPVIAQIGAVKLALEDDFPHQGTYRVLVRPIDRFGNWYAIDPLFRRCRKALSDVGSGSIITLKAEEPP